MIPRPRELVDGGLVFLLLVGLILGALRLLGFRPW